MRISKLGRKIPETEKEFWALYNKFEIQFVEMLSPVGSKIEIPSYEVVDHLMYGWDIAVKVKRLLTDK